VGRCATSVFPPYRPQRERDRPRDQKEAGDEDQQEVGVAVARKTPHAEDEQHREHDHRDCAERMEAVGGRPFVENEIFAHGAPFHKQKTERVAPLTSDGRTNRACHAVRCRKESRTGAGTIWNDGRADHAASTTHCRGCWCARAKSATWAALLAAASAAY